MYSFTKREQIVILVIAFVLISIVVYKFILEDKINLIQGSKILEIENENIQANTLISAENSQVEEENHTIMVHISGQVHKEGLLELKSGDRINDAVELAGGLKNEADIDRINLSKKVQDEEKIYIPKIGENIEAIEIIESSSNIEATSGKIDINDCTEQDLISLPGIGQVTARKIIDYRNQFKFDTIEDIMKVSGIGEKKFQAIKESIRVK